MLIIDETIYLERRTTGIIELIIDDYILQIGDTIIFAVKKNACEKNELIRKEVHIDKQANNVEIKINPEDTEQLDYLKHKKQEWRHIYRQKKKTVYLVFEYYH